MNPLDSRPTLRKRAYEVQFVVAGLLLLIGIGFGAAAVSLPTWYVVTTAVANGLWAYLGITARQNVDEH